MADAFARPMIDAAAWSLIHFFWQGAVIALVAAVVMRTARTAQVRYVTGLAGLALMLAAPLATFAMLVAPATPFPTALAAQAPAFSGSIADVAVVATDAPFVIISGAEIPVGALVGAWALGVCFFTLRLGGGWIVARRAARRTVQPAAAHIQALAAVLARRLDIRRAVAVLESSTAVVPMLVGWLKPVVVLPAAALAGLSPSQLEALIAHELAHVRRHDFLVNVLQSVVEALLFYHPAVWWLSRRVRQERELCCDDIVVGLCDRLVYATALSDLAAMTTPRVALAATDGYLLARIRRVLAGPGGDEMGAVRWLPAAILAVGLGIGMPGAMVLARADIAADPQQARHVRPDAHAVSHEIALEVHPEGPGALPEAVEALQAPQSQSPQEAELIRAIRELEAKLAELRKRERPALDRLPELDRAARELRDMQARIAEQARDNAAASAHARELERARELLKRGLLAESSVREIEQAVARSQRREVTNEVQAEVEAARRQADALRQLHERGLVTERQKLDAEARVADIVRHLSEQNVAIAEQARRLREQSDVQRAEVIERVRRDLIAHDAELEKQMAQLRDRRLIEVDPGRRADATQFVEQTRVITSGDTLRITIAGEPELPSTYPVRTDGTIRIPLLGSFKVVGQTSQQVREAIGRRLGELRLGSAGSVTIQLPRATRAR